MKKIILSFSIALAIFLVACQKEKSGNSNQLEVSKTAGIAMGEPVLFSMSQVPSGSEISWNVTPNKYVQLTPADNNAASVNFGQKGKYTITAITGTFSQSATVTVDSGICIPPFPVDTLRSLEGDAISLTPSVIDSGDSSILILSATTAKKYNCLNNNLIASLSFIDGIAGRDYTLEYPGVNIPRTCRAGGKKATAMTFVYPITVGAHNLKVSLNGKAYYGSFTKVGKTYTFTWPYASGVTISPLVVK